MPWACVAGLKLPLPAGKPGREAVWSRGKPLLSEEGGDKYFLHARSFGEKRNRARVNASAPYRRLCNEQGLGALGGKGRMSRNAG